MGSRVGAHSLAWGSMRPGSSVPSQVPSFLLLPSPLPGTSWTSFRRPHICVPNWIWHETHEPALPQFHLVMEVPYPLVTQAGDTGQYSTPPAPPATEAFCLLHLSLTISPTNPPISAAPCPAQASSSCPSLCSGLYLQLSFATPSLKIALRTLSPQA